MAEGRILEAVVGLCDCQTMALTVDLGGIRAVLPREELLYPWDGRPIRDIAAITQVGKPVQFLIQRILRPFLPGGQFLIIWILHKRSLRFPETVLSL